ncbi:hypothetical protein ACTWQF_10085 [Streptomyces sp. 8N114]|uniref:hypothetical protein n=1 Tax=Streptomyces sp. 8N114 TaxID=3457419 RepID=UPI003FCEE8DC
MGQQPDSAEGDSDGATADSEHQTGARYAEVQCRLADGQAVDDGGPQHHAELRRDAVECGTHVSELQAVCQYVFFGGGLRGCAGVPWAGGPYRRALGVDQAAGRDGPQPPTGFA